jgi:hypothetical protein
LLDYLTPFANEVNGQKAELTTDSVYSSAAGNQVMARLTEEAIHKL